MMTADFKIEKDIPLPPMRGSKYHLFLTMEKGDSVFIDGKTATQMAGKLQYIKRKSKSKFCSRKEGTGCRVWRIE